jgi:hypothetical protein
LGEAFGEMMRMFAIHALYGPGAATCTGGDDPGESLTLDALHDAVEEFTETWYYATSEYVERGDAFILPETPNTHRTLVFHDLEEVKAQIGPLTELVPIKEAEPKLAPIIPDHKRL